MVRMPTPSIIATTARSPRICHTGVRGVTLNQKRTADGITVNKANFKMTAKPGEVQSGRAASAKAPRLARRFIMAETIRHGMTIALAAFCHIAAKQTPAQIENISKNEMNAGIAAVDDARRGQALQN